MMEFIGDNGEDDDRMSDSEMLDYIVGMKRKARRSKGVKRVAYVQRDRERAMALLNEVENRGGCLADVADMLGMTTTTLTSWLRKATEPGTKWQLSDRAAIEGIALRYAAEIK